MGVDAWKLPTVSFNTIPYRVCNALQHADLENNNLVFNPLFLKVSKYNDSKVKEDLNIH